MKVQVLSIEPALEVSKFNVLLSIGEAKYQFTVKVEEQVLAGKELLLINGDADCWQLFKFNQNLEAKLYKLVGRLYNEELVEFPVYLGQLSLEKIRLLSQQLTQS